MKPLVSSAHQSVVKLLAQHNVMALEHQPCSPDLSRPNFFLFSQLKSVLKGQFKSAKEGTAKLARALTEVLKNGVHKCLQNTGQGNVVYTAVQLINQLQELFEARFLYVLLHNTHLVKISTYSYRKEGHSSRHS
jgi:hypothetical protein